MTIVSVLRPAVAEADAADPVHRATSAVAAASAPARRPDAVTAVLGGVLAGSLVVLVVVAPWVGGLVPVLALVPGVLWGLHVLATRRLDRSALLWSLALVPLVQWLSVTTALDPARSTVLAAESTLGWLCAAATVRCVRSDGRPVTVALGLGAVAVSAHALTGLGDLTTSAGGAVVSGRLQGPFAQPNELGAYCAMLLPLLVAAAVQLRDAALRVLAWAGTAVVVAALLLCLSRGAWAGAAAGVLLLAVLLPRTRPLLSVGAPVALAGLLGAMLLGPSGPAGVLLARFASMGSPEASPDDHRAEIWGLAARTFEAHPVLGAGPGGLLPASTAGDSATIGVAPLHAHNLVLTVASETGLVGLLALGVIALAAVRTVLSAPGATLPRPGTTTLAARRAATSGWPQLALVASVAAVAVHGLIDFPWRNPALTYTTWVVAGVVAATAAPDRTSDRSWRRTDMSQTPLSETTRTRAVERRRGAAAGRPVWRMPLLLGLLCSALLVGAVLTVLPTHVESTAVVGLRGEAGRSGTRPTPDEIKPIAQQYAVYLTSESTVDRARQDLGLGSGAGASASVDPESTTLRIHATGDNPDDATALADRLVRVTKQRAEDDDEIVVEVLGEPDAAHTQETPSRPLLVGGGLGVVWLLMLAFWLARRARWLS